VVGYNGMAGSFALSRSSHTWIYFIPKMDWGSIVTF